MKRQGRTRRYVSLEDWWAITVTGFVALLLIAWVGYTIASYHHKQSLTCTVNAKDRSSDGHDGSNVRIYTDQCGVLTVSDATFIGHFNSADTYSQIHPGHTYQFQTIGFRVPFLSDFPNIVAVREVSA